MNPEERPNPNQAPDPHTAPALPAPAPPEGAPSNAATLLAAADPPGAPGPEGVSPTDATPEGSGRPFEGDIGEKPGEDGVGARLPIPFSHAPIPMAERRPDDPSGPTAYAIRLAAALTRIEGEVEAVL